MRLTPARAAHTCSCGSHLPVRLTHHKTTEFKTNSQRLPLKLAAPSASSALSTSSASSETLQDSTMPFNSLPAVQAIKTRTK
nr:hypothetical protein [uncultured Capnocytophaga sp.]